MSVVDREIRARNEAIVPQVGRVSRLKALALLALALMEPGCSIKQIPATTPHLSAMAHGQRVLLLPTRVIYESVDTDQEVPLPPEATERAARVDQAMRERLVREGFAVVTPSELAGDVRQEVDAVLTGLQLRYVRLIGAGQDKSAFLSALGELARLTGAELGCVPVYYAKVGKSGGYNPNTGAIWTTTSSTSLRIGLVSFSTGERIWFREAFQRSVATRRDLERALNVLFEEE